MMSEMQAWMAYDPDCCGDESCEDCCPDGGCC